MFAPQEAADHGFLKTHSQRLLIDTFWLQWEAEKLRRRSVHSFPQRSEENFSCTKGEEKESGKGGLVPQLPF